MISLEREEKMITDFGVVVVSSELGSRLHLGGILSRLGLEPICVPSLRDCHETIVRKDVGLVFCDPRLTDGSYIDLLSAYRRKQRKPRIVITSQSADWDEFKEAMRWGAFDVVSSPCRPTDVEWVVIQAKRDERNRRKFDIGVLLPVHPNETAKVVSEGADTVATTASH
jgi:DNA-binding NtrC family response regulator